MSERYDDRPLDISIVIPVFDEADALQEVIQEVRAALADQRGNWEILVVDDGSKDRTSQVAYGEGVRVVRRVENGGYGAAVKRGILESRGEIIGLLDGDGSYVPAHLPSMLALTSEYDQINGARDCEPGTCKIMRVPAKWLVRKFAELIIGRRIPDLNTGLKVFKRSAALRYLWALPNGFSCSTSLTLAFLSNGHPVKYVPVGYRKRTGRSKFRPLRGGAQYLFTVVRLTTYFQPLNIFIPIAMLLGTASAVCGVYHLWTSPSGLADTEVLLGISSLLMFSIGALADLIVARGRYP